MGTFRFQITYDTLELCEDLREHKTDKCDFFPHEDVNFETEEDILVRAGKLLKIIDEFSRGAEKVLVVGHCDTFWYMTSHVAQGERFGKMMKNAEMLEWERSCPDEEKN